MSRVDDVVHNFIYTRGCAGLEEDSKKLLSDAVRYGFEQGESFGKYGAFIEKQNEKIAEAIIQPENDKAWKRELEDIKSSIASGNIQAKLLALIAEMILYRRRGG